MFQIILTSNDVLTLILSRMEYIETLFIEIISTSGKNIIVGTVYRPPSGNFDMFENKFNKILTKVDKSNKITYLMGDFNIDLLKFWRTLIIPADFASNYLPLHFSH